MKYFFKKDIQKFCDSMPNCVFEAGGQAGGNKTYSSNFKNHDTFKIVRLHFG